MGVRLNHGGVFNFGEEGIKAGAQRESRKALSFTYMKSGRAQLSYRFGDLTARRKDAILNENIKS